MVTNNENAEYGRSSGATINVASQSGTNRFHGTIYEFIRNTDLNAAGFFKPTLIGGTGITTPFKKPVFNRNQYGVNFGGPIVKNKLFFFLDYEGFRQVLKPLSVLTLPTQNELNGILVVTVKNPITGTVYPAGTPIPNAPANAPTQGINPLSAQIINYFKLLSAALPVTGVATTGVATSDYAVQAPFTDHSDKGDLRFDYQQSPNRSFFLRISDRKEDGVNNPSSRFRSMVRPTARSGSSTSRSFSAATQLFGSNKVLDARIGLDRTKAGKYNLSIGNTAFNNIPGLPTSNAVVAGGLPSIGIPAASPALAGRAPTRNGRIRPCSIPR